MHWCVRPTPLNQWVLAQVVEPSVLGARLVIADCPSAVYLPSLLSATALHCSSTQHGQHGAASNGANLSNSGSNGSGRDVYVIHLTNAKVRCCCLWSRPWCYPCLRMTSLAL